MPLDIHPDCKSRLIVELVKAIPNIKVKNGMFLERLDAFIALYQAEKILPANGKLHDQLLTFVDEFPFSDFISDTLSDELQNADYIAGEVKGKLTRIAGFDKPEPLAERLVEKFLELPKRYTLTLKLPSELSPMMGDGTTEVDLAPHIRIIRANSKFSEEFPLETDDQKRRERIGSGSLLFPEDAKWELGELYLQIGATGFIGIYGGSVPYQEAIRTLRTVAGLGLSLRLFQTDNQYVHPSPPLSWFLHEEIANDKWTVREKLTLDDNLSRAIKSLKLHNGDGWVDSSEKQIIWASNIFNEINTTFEGGTKAEKVLLAAQWYFDGNSGPDEMLKYIQSMVVLEILLGDKAASDQVGLNELLRNRCAYLIGDSHQDREQIHAEFKDIYDVRSQIVHRGKHRLSLKERHLSNRLRFMCRKVIQKEVDLLKADKRLKS